MEIKFGFSGRGASSKKFEKPCSKLSSLTFYGFVDQLEFHTSALKLDIMLFFLFTKTFLKKVIKMLINRILI